MKFRFPCTSALCLSLLMLAACGSRGKDQAPPSTAGPEVGVITVQPRNVPLTKDLVGRLSPYRSADVRARVAGILLQRVYEEGTDVRKGQLLFRIDPAPLKAALDASLASLAQAQATYTNAQIAARRIHELAPKGYVSKSDVDNAEAAERTSAAALQMARANVQTARINLGYASVTSPIAGRAGQQQVTEGALVGQGEATLLATVDQIDPLYVNFTLSISAMEQMRRAQRAGSVTLADQDKASVQLTLPGGSTYPEPGVLDFSDSTVNPSTGAVNLRAKIPNPGHRLLPGMYVTIRANLGQLNKVFLVPQQAVLRDTGGAYVLSVASDGKVKRRDISTGDMRGSDWVVTSGLQAGDRIIVSGVQKAREGMPVRALPWLQGGNTTARPSTGTAAVSGK